MFDFVSVNAASTLMPVITWLGRLVVRAMDLRLDGRGGSIPGRRD